MNAISRALVISVHLYDRRYHGLPEWPPSPARLFQALVAGAATGNLSEADRIALEWLETLNPPLIGSPTGHVARGFTIYVPNNDLDAVGRDPGRTSEIRAGKWIKARLFDSEPLFLYIWSIGAGEDDERAASICSIADRLYQFGRGTDMACAHGEVVPEEELAARLFGYSGLIYRPSPRGDGRPLACPKPGSLKSLRNRYAASARRFEARRAGAMIKQVFSQPPKPHFAQIEYESPPSQQVYEIRELTPESSFLAWPLREASTLVVLLRDLAVDKLRAASPHRSADIERFMVGRNADGVAAAPTTSRVRIVPLPSIGHPHADQGIRRVLVEVPAECPLRSDDVHWAFSGLDVVSLETGEIRAVLTASDDEAMAFHFGIADTIRSRVWRTVTPAALPEKAMRRRIEPTRLATEAKSGAERTSEQARAATAVIQALRHAEIHAHAEFIRVQREPFDARGERVEAFAPGTRFAKERLWHVEVTFDTPIAGPLVIGDGRFLGLGVMRPVQRNQGVYVFAIESGLSGTAQATEIARALRRAVMARVQATIGPRAMLPRFFSGHERDGSPVRGEGDAHLTFGFDPNGARLLVLAPHVLERRAAQSWELEHLKILEASLTGFRDLRAGTAGRLVLKATSPGIDADPLFAPSRTWVSATPYQVARHTKRVGAVEAFAADVRAECRRRGLPDPSVTPREMRGVPGVGLTGSVQLTFQVAIEGPLVLGRSRHLGGGLFVGGR